MKKLFLFTFLTFFVFSPLANAEIQTYEGTGEYIMSDFETPDIAKQRAKARAEQSAVEQAGVFVKSYTRTVNSVVAEDEIIAIANTIIKITKVDYTTTPVNDSGGSFRIVAKIKADVDSTRIDAWLKRGAQEKADLVEQNKRLQQEKVKQDAEIAELRKKLANAASEQEKKNLEKDVVSADRKFLSNQKVEEGKRLYDKNNYIEAIARYSQAIGLDENNYIAYFYRGKAYRWQETHERWERSRNKKGSPTLKDLAELAGPTTNSDLAKLQLALADYSKCIALNPPNLAEVYSERAGVYRMLENYEKAIADYNKAIEISPNDVHQYQGRGSLYMSMNNYQQAILDLNKFIELYSRNPKDTYTMIYAYNLRGDCYRRLGNLQQANKDFAKAKELRYKG